MELLKKLILVLLVSLTINTFAQDYKAMEEAFQKSIGYENKQDYTNAIDVLKPFATATNYEANVRLGWLYYSAGKHNESVSYYLKSITLKPAAAEPLWGIVYPYAELKKWTELQAIYQKIISLDPKNTTANYRLGLSYSSGRLTNGWAFNFAGSYKRNDGWFDNMHSRMWFYYGKVEKKI